MQFTRVMILLSIMTGLFLAVGYLIAGVGGALIAFLLALGMNAFAYWNSDRMVLSMHHAHEVDDRSAPAYHGMVQHLATKAGMPMPRVYIIETDQPNAFATGRDPNHAAVAATTGLLNSLSPEELSGVMAHELAHVQHRDTLTMTIVATLAGAISMVANFAMLFTMFGGNRDENGNSGPLGFIGVLLTAILAPIAASLVQMFISRSNEYAADRGGAEICGNPLWLASALRKLEEGARSTPFRAADEHPGAAHLFIVNPLRGGGMDNLFATHPSTENRVAQLEQMAHARGWRTAPPPDQPVHRPGPWG